MLTKQERNGCRMENKNMNKSVRKLKDECQKVRVRLKTTGETSNEPDTTFQQKQKHSHREENVKNFKKLSDALTVQTEEKSRRVQESNTKNTRERVGGKGGTATCDKRMPCAFVFNLEKNRSKEMEPKKGMGKKYKTGKRLETVKGKHAAHERTYKKIPSKDKICRNDTVTCKIGSKGKNQGGTNEKVCKMNLNNEFLNMQIAEEQTTFKARKEKENGYNSLPARTPNRWKSRRMQLIWLTHSCRKSRENKALILGNTRTENAKWTSQGIQHGYVGNKWKAMASLSFKTGTPR